MNLFHDAIATFTRVIQGYPEGTIATFNGNEHGRTAAKALYGRIRCHLVLGDTDSAKKDLDTLKKFDGDSYVIDDEGRKRTYHELANDVMTVATSP